MHDHAEALPPNLEHSFKRELKHILSQHPRYKWGGSVSEKKGLDCSGTIFLAAKRAGIPGVTRQTAINMARGFGGWDGDAVGVWDADEGDLLFWTWKSRPDRKWGHVGAGITGDRSGLIEALHASSSKNQVVIQPLKGALINDLELIKHLTIGERRVP